MVEPDRESPDWHKQTTGIRQGCHLSPYLFLIAMTARFTEVHDELEICTEADRPPGVDFEEVLYADDTIYISLDTRSINNLIAEIEEVGDRYGMKLNKGRCEAMITAANPNLHFRYGTRIKFLDQVTYLGCDINLDGNTTTKLGMMITKTMTILKQLDLFWRHGSCQIKIKLIALDAVIRSKLLYGMETAQLNEPQLK